jgi:hypothetical protein
MKRKAIYGLLAEFETPEQLLAAAHRTHDAGYKSIDAFTPMPVEGMAEAVGFGPTGRLHRRASGRADRIFYVLLRERNQFPAEYWRQAV